MTTLEITGRRAHRQVEDMRAIRRLCQRHELPIPSDVIAFFEGTENDGVSARLECATASESSRSETIVKIIDVSSLPLGVTEIMVRAFPEVNMG